MKKIMILALALLTMGSQAQADTMAKEKKNKKELKWEWDGTKSGNATIDNYLMEIDTLWNRLQEYKESINAYQFKTDTLVINGEYYVLGRMLNSDGQLVTRGTVNWQCAQAVMNGVNIVLDMTNAGLGSANAALELPKLGLNALKIGKYVKGGPAVIAGGIKTIKEMREQWIQNSRDWKGLKAGAVADPASLNYFDAATLEKLNKCMYLKKIVQEDESYEKVVQVVQSKSPEQQKTELEALMAQIQKEEMAPEDAKKSSDDLGDFEEMLKNEKS